MNLREIRKRRNLTQEELAAVSGVDQATISNLEVQRVKNPGWIIVAKLAKALAVSPEELFPVEFEQSKSA
jgi:transcriptional regulator with XRE-family HTH domain